MSDAAIIEMQGVDKWFGEFHVLRGIDFSVARGEKVEEARQFDS